MPKVNGKIYYNNVTGEVLVVINQNEGAWIRETTFKEDVAVYPQLKELNTNAISVIRLDWDQYKRDLETSRPVKVVNNKIQWVPFDNPTAQPTDKTLSELVAELQKQTKILQTQQRSLAQDQNFLTAVVVEVIETTVK